MTNWMSTRQRIIFLLSIGLIVLLSMMSFRANNNTTYWYVNNEQYEWNYQEDVYAFNLDRGKKYTDNLDPNVVDYLHYGGVTCSKFNFIYFNSQSSDDQREQVIEQVISNVNFLADYDVVTLFPHLEYDKGMWFVTDDLMMVNFDNEVADQQWIEHFAYRYDLFQVNDLSDLPAGGNYTYIYRMSPTDVSTIGGIGIAREIYETDSNFLINAQPNLINAYEGMDMSTSINDNNPASKAKFYVTNANNTSLQVFYTLPETIKTAYINVYDYYGHVVYSKQVTARNGNESMDITELPAGLYISNIQAHSGKILGTQKFRVL